MTRRMSLRKLARVVEAEGKRLAKKVGRGEVPFDAVLQAFRETGDAEPMIALDILRKHGYPDWREMQ